MSGTTSSVEESLIAQALRSASHTRLLVAEAGVRHDSQRLFAAQFGTAAAVVVADENTFAAAGRDVCQSFSGAKHPSAQPFIFGRHIYADDRCVAELQVALGSMEAIPVAVGSGTINDVTKLAAHRLNRPYMVVATAASMDGYTAFGASITSKGSKQTFDCPAPKAVLADLEVMAAAPPGMNAAGYADLVAKVAAGADWIVADALGVEAIEPAVWDTVQKLLPAWIESPAGIARNEPAQLRRLVYGLMMSGFAMQAARSSRAASGADHQFSHLWDMQHHRHNGSAPSHGFKVGIGTLASIALYEELLKRDLGGLDIDVVVKKWHSLDALGAQISNLFGGSGPGSGGLAEKAYEETKAKYVSPQALREQLGKLRAVWPDVRTKLTHQLLPFSKVQTMLQEAGCPYAPEQIGISRDHLRLSYEQALFIRRRFTILDLAHRTGLLEASLENLFRPAGRWSAGAPSA